jgi:hypothetical protein
VEKDIDTISSRGCLLSLWGMEWKGERRRERRKRRVRGGEREEREG